MSNLSVDPMAFWLCVSIAFSIVFLVALAYVSRELIHTDKAAQEQRARADKIEGRFRQLVKDLESSTGIKLLPEYHVHCFVWTPGELDMLESIVSKNIGSTIKSRNDLEAISSLWKKFDFYRDLIAKNERIKFEDFAKLLGESPVLIRGKVNPNVSS